MSYRALVVLLLLAAPAACTKANSAAGGGPGGGAFAMPVEVSPAIRDTVVDAIAATGQIEAIQAIELRPEVSGRITDILVREGQEVGDRTVVRAPFAGVIGRRLVSIGTYVSPQTPLITLQSVNPQHASFDVPERYADRLRRGQLVSFQVAALPGKNFSGEV